MTDPSRVLTVTLNPALDLTYHVPDITIGAVHRIRQPSKRAGGKGVNVARVLHQLEVPVTAFAVVGGMTGRQVAAEFAASQIPADFLDLPAGETRHTVTITDGSGGSTLFNEPGPEVDESTLDDVGQRISEHACNHDVVVFSGRLPPGLPADTYAGLIRVAGEAGARTVLDTSGPALLAGVRGEPDLVKPNRDELAEATGTTDPSAGAAVLRRAGARAVAVSLGANGLFLATAAGCWRTRVSEPTVGNATGAGDATVAGLVLGLLGEEPWPARAALGVAAGTAAVHDPTAGQIDLEVFTRLRRLVPAGTVAVDRDRARS